MCSFEKSRFFLLKSPRHLGSRERDRQQHLDCVEMCFTYESAEILDALIDGEVHGPFAAQRIPEDEHAVHHEPVMAELPDHGCHVLRFQVLVHGRQFIRDWRLQPNGDHS